MTRGRQRKVTAAGIIGGAGLVLALFQQLAVTRQSFVQAAGGRDQLAAALAAKQDTLAWTRDSLRFVRHIEKACRRRHRLPASHELEGFVGPPQPKHEGALRNVLGTIASAPVNGLKWLFGL